LEDELEPVEAADVAALEEASEVAPAADVVADGYPLLNAVKGVKLVAPTFIAMTS
jgi:hypothetical protein